MIFFDIDGTLLDHKGAELEGIKKFYQKYKFDKITNLEKFKLCWVDFSNKNFKKYLTKELSFEEQRANRIIDVFNEFGISITYKDGLEKFNDYLKVYEESWRAYEDVIPCLESLNGYKLGIISNGDHQQQIKKLEKIGVIRHFDDVITAGGVGVAKPNIQIFKIACERNSVKIENSYYIGDDVKSDIIPCKQVGMNAILINRTNQEVDKDICQITSFNEVKKLIQRI